MVSLGLPIYGNFTKRAFSTVPIRISGVDIPQEKRIEVALTYVYGVGRSLSNKILEKAEIDPDTRAKDLTEQETSKIREALEGSYAVEGELRATIARNIKRLKDIRCYRGLRHRQGLPVRGQRTQTNARTRKGRRQKIGIGRKRK